MALRGASSTLEPRGGRRLRGGPGRRETTLHHIPAGRGRSRGCPGACKRPHALATPLSSAHLEGAGQHPPQVWGGAPGDPPADPGRAGDHRLERHPALPEEGHRGGSLVVRVGRGFQKHPIEPRFLLQPHCLQRPGPVPGGRTRSRPDGLQRQGWTGGLDPARLQALPFLAHPDQRRRTGPVCGHDGGGGGRGGSRNRRTALEPHPRPGRRPDGQHPGLGRGQPPVSLHGLQGGEPGPQAQPPQWEDLGGGVVVHQADAGAPRQRRSPGRPGLRLQRRLRTGLSHRHPGLRRRGGLAPSGIRQGNPALRRREVRHSG